MRLWKLLGMAGVAGVAATGVVLVRNERERRAYSPDDVRAKLLERAAAAPLSADPDLSPRSPVSGDRAVTAPFQRARRLWRRLRSPGS